MPATPARHRPLSVAVLIMGLGVGLATLPACRQKRDPAPERMDPAQAARLGLTPDARDPTERDNEAGYGRWRTKPEPTGTADPLAPSRRRVDPRG